MRMIKKKKKKIRPGFDLFCQVPTRDFNRKLKSHFQFNLFFFFFKWFKKNLFFRKQLKWFNLTFGGLHINFSWLFSRIIQMEVGLSLFQCDLEKLHINFMTQDSLSHGTPADLLFFFSLPRKADIP